MLSVAKIADRARTKINKKGRLVTVTTEHYLRDDISCQSSLCRQCNHKNSRAKQAPGHQLVRQLGSFKTTQTSHYIVPSLAVALKYLEWLEVPDTKDIILCETIMKEVRAHCAPFTAFDFLTCPSRTARLLLFVLIERRRSLRRNAGSIHDYGNTLCHRLRTAHPVQGPFLIWFTVFLSRWIVGSDIVSNPHRRAIVFNNEFSRHTYTDRLATESLAQYKERC